LGQRDGLPSDEMRTCASFGELRRVNAQRPAGRASGVAICATELDHFRSLQSAATVADFRNIRISEHLRPKSRPTAAAQFCTNRSKVLRRLQIRQTRNKKRQTGSSARGFPQPSRRKRPEIGVPERRKAGNNTAIKGAEMMHENCPRTPLMLVKPRRTAR